ncbi:sushi, von Willebrand factor type A, EGF and pentraxin domain-containing protein 1-like isoform X2 [Watersipora subatra]|uniref:sushi, von Willebrand factor type A, EGF and pentraxin domain-containing protein 1-like isoform X2 n=1 Tax=Watersipora subatra TaxID=2589382 RepID=UPI00355B4B72
MVDLIFVIDKSGSVGKRLVDAKIFTRDFLGYFSIAVQHTQVGVILFSSDVTYSIPLRDDEHKCNFMSQLDNPFPKAAGNTNIAAGLQRAVDVFRQNSRRNTGAFGVVVLITDGYYNTGGDPIGQVNTLKKEKVLVIVITIGVGNAEMQGWSSKDNRGKDMYFHLTGFNQFVQLAHYIHKGGQKSKFLPIKDNGECGYLCSGGASCLCDTLASRGKPLCGCDLPGNYIKPVSGKETCAACQLGKYQEGKTTSKECKSCPSGQTTLAIRSSAISQCVCNLGYWNRNDHSRTPLNGVCDRVSCTRDSLAVLDQHNLELSGQCQFTYGQKCDYKCFQGFITGGILTRECQQDGTMNPPPAKCTPLLCPPMPAVPNSAGWKCASSGRSLGGNMYPYQSECRNECNAGYLPRPGTNSFIICGLDENRQKADWSGTSLISRTCTNLPEVMNGQYNIRECSDPNLEDRTFGKLCKVQCHTGYLISEDINWICKKDGQWSNYDKTVTCRDIQEPQIIACPQHVYLDNEENQGYAVVELKPLRAIDNDRSSSIRQIMQLTMPGASSPLTYPCTKVDCGESSNNFPIGTTFVNFTVTDRSRNSGYCSYEITVRDVEAPKVVKCDGPKTDVDGFIYSDSDKLYVTWDIPVFSDNSGKPPHIYSSNVPGEYKSGRPWKVTYTAEDEAGNTAKCEFTFKIRGIRCPQLHRPANGALLCDKLSFGVYCSPQCQHGLDRLMPVDIVRKPNEYFCTLQGKWLPHDKVGDCALSVPVTNQTKPTFEFSWFLGDCEDESTKQQIIQNMLSALHNNKASYAAQAFQSSFGRDLTADDFEVFCGAKNESIVQIGGGVRYKRETYMFAPTYISAQQELENQEVF